jgi:hypothetical protein
MPAADGRKTLKWIFKKSVRMRTGSSESIKYRECLDLLSDYKLLTKDSAEFLV